MLPQVFFEQQEVRCTREPCNASRQCKLSLLGPKTCGLFVCHMSLSLVSEVANICNSKQFTLVLAIDKSASVR